METYRRHHSWTIALSSDALALTVVAVIAIGLRTLPQLVAYPYPIGYDVVNYYMPVTTNLDKHWGDIAQQFPFYAIILHAIFVLTGWGPNLVVPIFATLVFSAFAVSIFIFGRRSLGLPPAQASFLALFVIVQVAVLRTTWDLHRDMLALSGMMFGFAFLKKGRFSAVSLAFAILAAVSDRMVGIFLTLTLLTWSIVSKDKWSFVTALLLAVVLFGISGSWLVAPLSAIANGQVGTAHYSNSQYNATNLFVLFLVIDGLLVVPALYGFLKSKPNPIRIGALIALVASFSWLILPGHEELASDRWIVLLGVSLSILAGYGIVRFSDNLRSELRKIVMLGSLSFFAVFGIAYAVLPYEHPFLFFGSAKDYFETFSPPTMQFSVLDVNETGRLIGAIQSVNVNTESNSIIVGTKDWKGFMELYLAGDRQYEFSDNPKSTVCNLLSSSKPVYLFTYSKQYALTIRASSVCS